MTGLFTQTRTWCNWDSRFLKDLISFDSLIHKLNMCMRLFLKIVYINKM